MKFAANATPALALLNHLGMSTSASVQRKRRAPELRVLVVDDEPLIRRTIVELLTRDGHSADSASNGIEGLDKLRAGAFDVVITDRTMPHMTGDELAAEIKRASPEMPVIMLTGWAETMTAAGEHPAGVDVLVGKPPTIESIRRALDEAPLAR